MSQGSLGRKGLDPISLLCFLAITTLVVSVILAFAGVISW